MLPLEATDQELAALHGSLTTLWRADSETWTRLFNAQAPTSLPVDDRDINRIIGSGLVEEGLFGWVGRHRLRVESVGPRPRIYALGLDDGVGEYQQDIWPETDALLAVMASRRAGRLLDVGTGCGVMAIEAATRGWTVVATDLYERTLTLARWNARLNGVRIELRAGDLYAPVDGEQFDLVLSLPHYGRVYDQLRVEVLRGGLDRVAPGGALVTAGPLEWTGPPGDEKTVGLRGVLAALAARGADVRVRPVDDARKRIWFQVPVPEAPTGTAKLAPEKMIARHRFVLEVKPGAARVDIGWPVDALYNRVDVVPLARLREPGRPAFGSSRWGAVTDGADLAALEATLVALAAPESDLDGAWPAALYDGCRFGARTCVVPGHNTGAAGAVVSPDGSVRPCAHGEAYGTVDDRMTTLAERLQQFAVDAQARRGCATCPAADVCSRCLHPVIVDEAQYCDLIRRHRAALPVWLRLLPLLAGLPPPFRLRRWPRGDAPAHSDARAAAIQSGWLRGETWIVERRRGEPVLVWTEGKGQQRLIVPPSTASLGAAIADGHLPAGADEPSLQTLLSLFGA